MLVSSSAIFLRGKEELIAKLLERHAIERGKLRDLDRSIGRILLLD